MTDTATTEPFEEADQQKHASALGIWVFLATEVLFFGALFTQYAIMRMIHADAFFEAARTTRVWFGTANTAILLTSGLTMALAFKGEKADCPKVAVSMLWSTVLLGFLFLLVKGAEYYLDIRDGFIPGSASFPLEPAATQSFWSVYWLLTVIHAVHLSIGLVLIAVVAHLIRKGRLRSTTRASVMEVTSLYWAFVDMMWLFIYPLIYLAGRAG
ncbi:MAG: cytochrome c oxidase subunit 3 [Proteobacteria bacterium]|nr:cytochrome c oxidase subunit 3 [Pseudomonadota bacterium]